MKNKHIKNLGEVVPAKIRLEVYKEALEIIEKNLWKSGTNGHGLCVLLPCCLWNLISFLDKAPDGKDWKYQATTISFPELDSKILNKLNKTNTEKEINKLRIKFLKKFIVKLES